MIFQTILTKIISTNMTNSEILTEIDAKIKANGIKSISAVIMNGILKLFVARLPVEISKNLEPGWNEVTHELGAPPSHITFWQKLPDSSFILLSNMDTKVEDATKTTKFFVNAPEAMTNIKIKISL